MKLHNVQAYSIKDVPDHLTHECSLLGQALLVEVKNLFENKDPNIILGAINFFYSAMLKDLISDKPEEQKKAARMAAIAILKNVYFLNGLDFEEELK